MTYGCVGCAISAAPAMAPAGGEAAVVVVKADPNVTIKVNGQIAPRKGNEDTYQSPALTAGRNYTYTVVAEFVRDGKTLTETKEISVQAGRRTEVDFSTLGTAVAKAEDAPANVTVILPEGAKLTVNDVAVNVAGNQTFQTPKLEPGKSYFYTVKADVVRNGKSVTETRRIDVAAGKSVTVDFTAASTLTASR